MEFFRQYGIVIPSELPPVTMIGAGGIGSMTALALAKTGVPMLYLIDDDAVEEHNLPNQFFRHSDLGENKVRALANAVKEYSISEVQGYKTCVKSTHPLSGVVISGVDSMESRKAIWAAVYANRAEIPIYIEARMAREIGIIYTVDPSNPQHWDWYLETLCDDADAIEVPCTERAVAYNVWILGGRIAAQVKKFAKGEPMYFEIIEDITNTQTHTRRLFTFNT